MLEMIHVNLAMWRPNNILHVYSTQSKNNFRSEVFILKRGFPAKFSWVLARLASFVSVSHSQFARVD